MSMPSQKKLLLSPPDIPPSQDDLEVIGVFNPAAVEFHDEVQLMVRVAERPKEKRTGYSAFPRWEAGKVVVDWHKEEEHVCVDARVARHRETGRTRLTFASHLRLVNCGSGEAVVRVE